MTLRRRLGVSTAASVVVASMIGTGIFTTSGLLLRDLQSGWLVLACWALGGLLALSGSLCYAELSTMMPQAGGEYVYLREIYGPWAGFLTGWTSFFVGFAAPIAAAGVACAEYLAAAGLLSQHWVATKGTAITLVLALTVVHYRGVRSGAWAQNFLTALKLLLIGGLVVLGFLWGRGDWQPLGSTEFWSGGHWSRLGVAMLWVMFAYSGWNSSSYLAEEVREPGRTLPRSLLLGTLTVAGIYLVVNLLFFYAAPVSELSGVIAVGKVAAEGLFGAQAASWFSLLIATALLSSLSAYIFIGPRVYYAMARDGLFFRFAARVHPRFETPALSIAAQSLCAIVMILTGTFEELLTYIGFALGIFPWMAVLGVVLLRRRRPAQERPYRVWGYPLVPLFFLLVWTWILVVGFINRPGPSLLALATVAAGIPVYRLTVGRRGPSGENSD